MQENVNEGGHIVAMTKELGLGKVITYVLNYELSTEPINVNHRKSIMTFMRNSIWNVEINEQVELGRGIIHPVQVKWEMPGAGSTCSNYYTTQLLYSDNAIHKHTTEVMKKLTAQIRIQHPEFGNDWGLAFIVSRVNVCALLSKKN